MKIEYNLSKQENDYFCVPAVVQAILRRYGREETQTEIAKQLGFKENVGVDFNSDLTSFFFRRGLNFRFQSPNEIIMRAPRLVVDDWLRDKADLMIGYSLPSFPKNLFHLSLATSSTEEEITLLDPKDCSIQIKNIDDLYAQMCRTNFGGFGLVKLIEE